MALGKPVPMLDSVARVSGAVEYMVNLRLPDMLVGKVVRSTVPHGELLNVDGGAASKADGVAALVTRENLGCRNLYGVGIKDQPVLAQGQVRYIGEPLALVAAEEKEAAEEAANLVIVDYEELPPLFDALVASRTGAPTLHSQFPDNIFKYTKLRHGDIEAGFAEADNVFEDTFYSPIAQQASLEPHVAAAQWRGERLTVWSATQAPYMVRRVLADLFSIPQENIRVIVHPLGGGYGGKGHVRIEPLAAALAQQTRGRPVKIVLSREEEFVTVTKHAAHITLKTGVRKDGSFTARQVTIYWNGGAYADASALLVGSGMVRAIGPYRIPAVWVDSYGVYTNLPPAAAFRGAMSSQTTWAYESQMDLIARRMGWDPLEFRRRNLLRDGDQFATGELMHDVHFAECLDAVAEGLGWGTKAKRVDTNREKHGRGLAVMMKSTVAKSRSECRISLSQMGEICLYTSTVEMGQGSHTALAQIAADALHVPLGHVEVKGPDTESTPFDSTTSASRSTNMMGNAVRAACDALLIRLLDLASQVLEVPRGDLLVRDGGIFSPESDDGLSYGDILRRHNLKAIEEVGTFATDFGLDPETGQGIATPHWHQGAGAVEVAVDVETGKVTLLDYYASSFAGRIVNPALVRLQNEGNVIFGIGPALMEEMIFDGGQLTNPNLSDYMIPSIRDIPKNLKSLSLESEKGELHGIGEMTLPPVAPAIANAIEDAVGVRIKDLPITAEKVLRALKEDGA